MINPHFQYFMRLNGFTTVQEALKRRYEFVIWIGRESAKFKKQNGPRPVSEFTEHLRKITEPATLFDWKENYKITSYEPQRTEGMN